MQKSCLFLLQDKSGFVFVICCFVLVFFFFFYSKESENDEVFFRNSQVGIFLLLFVFQFCGL